MRTAAAPSTLYDTGSLDVRLEEVQKQPPLNFLLVLLGTAQFHALEQTLLAQLFAVILC